MDRRAFIKALTGVTAAAALPGSLDAIADAVALPGELSKFTLLYWKRSATTHAWEQVAIPLVARTMEEAEGKAQAALDGDDLDSPYIAMAPEYVEVADVALVQEPGDKYLDTKALDAEFGAHMKKARRTKKPSWNKPS